VMTLPAESSLATCETVKCFFVSKQRAAVRWQRWRRLVVGRRLHRSALRFSGMPCHSCHN
jgi:hypothetical protein